MEVAGNKLHYLGGKKRISKPLTNFLNQFTKNKIYIEPFVGSAAVIENIEALMRVGIDVNHYLIALFQALQSGWIPPDFISEALYNEVKENPGDFPQAMVAFVGIGCSWGGKWWGGYARDNTGRNYALNAKNTLLKQLPKIKDIGFIVGDYKTLAFQDGSIIYCDPPYKGTTMYNFNKTFDHDFFWERVRQWSECNSVFVSEYEAPDDFECILEIPTRTDLHGKNKDRIEKLFIRKK